MIGDIFVAFSGLATGFVIGWIRGYGLGIRDSKYAPEEWTVDEEER